jgi:death-on-curing protein
MSEPVWVPADLVIAIHDMQLKLFGGPAGLRDAGALESALGRAQNRYAYDNADLASLAAAYAFGIARNHPFIDGNKRAALLTLVTFLGLNGVDFIVDEAEAVVMIRGLAAGEVDEAGLTRWIRDNLPEPSSGLDGG